jgi:predicted P-loop ATPase
MEKTKEKGASHHAPPEKVKTNNRSKDRKTSVNGEAASERNKTAWERTEDYLKDNFSFRYNSVSNRVMYQELLTKEPEKELKSENLYRRLKKNGFNISQADLNAMLASDFVERYDPISMYFLKVSNLLPISRDYIGEFASYLKFRNEKDSERFVYHFKKWLVRAIKCAMEPGQENKQCLVLQGGKHNTGKTTYLRKLVPKDLEQYFTEDVNFNDKDGLIAICQNFLINLDEMSTVGKSDLNKTKSVFSKQWVKVRHPYGKKDERTQRRASFMGSLNEQEFLTDPTGSVRWLVFQLESIDWSYSQKVDVDKVWAHAYSLYLDKTFDPKISPKDVKEIEDANQRFQLNSAEIELLPNYFRPGSETDYTDFFTATHILSYIQAQNFSIKMNANNLGKALNKLGFEKKSKRIGSNTDPVWGYYVKKL